MPAQDEDNPPVLNYATPSPPVIPRYRKVMSAVLVLAGIVVGVGSSGVTGAARENVLTAAFALMMSGLVIRFQHVRL